MLPDIETELKFINMQTVNSAPIWVTGDLVVDEKKIEKIDKEYNVLVVFKGICTVEKKDCVEVLDYFSIARSNLSYYTHKDWRLRVVVVYFPENKYYDLDTNFKEKVSNFGNRLEEEDYKIFQWRTPPPQLAPTPRLQPPVNGAGGKKIRSY